jgi:hypothetical protein
MSKIGKFLFVVLIVLCLGFFVSAVSRMTNGFSSDLRYTQVSDGISKYMYDGDYTVKSNEVTFTITDYSNQNKEVTVSISANTENDFTYVVNGVLKSYKTEFSGVKLDKYFDLSYSSTSFSFTFKYDSMESFLKNYYQTSEISLNTSVDISVKSYFNIVIAQTTDNYTITLHLLYGIQTSVDTSGDGSSSDSSDSLDSSGSSGSDDLDDITYVPGRDDNDSSSGNDHASPSTKSVSMYVYNSYYRLLTTIEYMGGTTWAQWVNSSDNTFGIFIKDDYVRLTVDYTEYTLDDYLWCIVNGNPSYVIVATDPIMETYVAFVGNEPTKTDSDDNATSNDGSSDSLSTVDYFIYTDDESFHTADAELDVKGFTTWSEWLVSTNNTVGLYETLDGFITYNAGWYLCSDENTKICSNNKIVESAVILCPGDEGFALDASTIDIYVEYIESYSTVYVKLATISCNNRDIWGDWLNTSSNIYGITDYDETIRDKNFNVLWEYDDSSKKFVRVLATDDNMDSRTVVFREDN